MHQNATNFRRLNVEGRWPGFAWRGLQLDADGSLRLLSLPRRTGGPPAPHDRSTPVASAGVAAACGDLFYTEVDRNHLVRIERCGGETEQIAGPSGFRPGLHSPRGLAASPDGRFVYVCDSGHGRIALLRTDTLEWSDTWDGLGSLLEPVDVAVDHAGFVYVVDQAGCAVRRLSPRGTPVPEFWSRVAAGGLRSPVNVAAVDDSVFVLDSDNRAVFAFRGDGSPLLDASGDPVVIGRGLLNDPRGLAADGASVYVGDNAAGRVLVFGAAAGFALTGHAVDYHGAVAALSIDGCGRLFVHPGHHAPVGLRIAAAFGARGLLFGGPFTTNEPTTTWHRLRAAGDVPPGTDMQLFVHTTDSDDIPPYEPDLPEPFPAPVWRTAPSAAADLFVDAEPKRSLWVGAVLASDGDATPRLMDLRAEFNHDTLLPLLPRPYRQEAFRNDQLTRLLSLFETFFDDVDDLSAEQVSWLDPFAAPATVLPWLASWLEVELNGEWTDEARRRTIAQAYAQSARTGTPSALREALWREAGVRAVIHEPLQAGRVWVLGSCRSASAPPASLGATTSLAAADPDGAILGRTATLGAAHLIGGDEIGSHLFEGMAHRFTVHISQRAFRTSRRARAERVIERDKPAHTAYALSEIRPALSVGVQARLGVTTIIGHRPLPGRLGRGPMVLSGEPAGHVGTALEVGRSTRL